MQQRRSNATISGAATKSSSLSSCGSRDPTRPWSTALWRFSSSTQSDEHRSEAHRPQHQLEDHYLVQIQTLSKQSEIQHRFPDDAHQKDTEKLHGNRKSHEHRTSSLINSCCQKFGKTFQNDGANQPEKQRKIKILSKKTIVFAQFPKLCFGWKMFVRNVQ